MYSSEQHLLADFSSAYKRISSSDVSFFQEVWTNFGVPDLIVISYDRDKLQRRNQAMRNRSNGILFPKQAGFAMCHISNEKETTIEELGEYFSLSQSQTRSLLMALEGRGLVTYRDKGRIAPLPETLIVNEIQTYEAKLTDWKRAIAQAERHLWFTRDSYVLMPEMSAPVLNKVIRHCASTGIGLICQSKDSRFAVVHEPAEEGFQNSYMSWILNEMLVDRLCHGYG